MKRRVKSAKRLHRVATDRQIKSSRSASVVPTTLQKSVPSFRRKLRGSSRRRGGRFCFYLSHPASNERTRLRLAVILGTHTHSLALSLTHSVISVAASERARPSPEMRRWRRRTRRRYREGYISCTDGTRKGVCFWSSFEKESCTEFNRRQTPSLIYPGAYLCP